MSRVYFHIDLNAFFASCEELLDPSLKGKPLVVGGKSRRSVISTANYEARKYGIHSAMPMQQAEKLCKDLVIVNGHYAFYSDMSHQFMQIIHSYTDLVEKASIDECYADMTDVICRYPKPLDVAFEIQRRVLEETGLRCSIGIGPNMFLAKMASDMKKPMGITVLRIRDVPEKMWPLPIKEMQGIGKRTVPLMEDLNIHTIKDLATYQNLNALKPVLGKNIKSMIKRANGYDDRTLMTDLLKAVTMSVNGNTDVDFISLYVDNMNAEDAYLYRTFVSDNMPRIDAKIKLNVTDNQEMYVQLLIDDEIFLNV